MKYAKKSKKYTGSLKESSLYCHIQTTTALVL